MTDAEGTFLVPPPAGWEEARTVAWALVEAATPADGYTIDHAVAVADLSRLVGTEMSLGGDALEALTLGGLLHDLGKLGVAGSILQKAGPLTGWEARIVKGHPDIGARMVEPLGCLRRVALAIRHHHECYDGGGYPDGLQGEEIPLSARIVAATDAYDVMVRGRSYAGIRPPTEAIGELLEEAGGQFDARVVAALARVAV
jgi:putative nucleotidyltransferase with HDIG domain